MIKRHKLAIAVVLVSITYLAITYLIISKIAEKFIEEDIAELYALGSEELSTISAEIESSIYSDIYIAQGLVTLLHIDENLALEQFNAISENLISRGKYIRNIGVSPDDVITHLYPLLGNEKALGLNFKTNTDQYATIAEAKRRQSVFIAGPLELVQGGNAIIARYPIFTDFPTNNDYWGGVSVVLDIDTLLADASVANQELNFTFAIRGVNGKGENGQIFYGDHAIFTQPTLTKTVTLPSGSWQIGAILNDALQMNIVQRSLLFQGVSYTVAFLFWLSIMLLLRAYRFAHETSLIDELTKLPNRRYAMSELIKGQQRAGSAFTILNIDVNGLKFVNDNYGHDAGDYLLKNVAKKMVKTLRSSDIVTRLGGDEFLVILPRLMQQSQQEQIINKLKTAVNDMGLIFNTHDIPTSISVGSAMFPSEANDIESLMKVADQAMYQDKLAFKASQNELSK